MANHLHSELVLDALEMAVTQRQPRDVIHHSDQGSQYTSLAFGSRCREAGVRPSMGSVGAAYDEAMAESYFATLECDLLARRRFRSQAEPRMTCFSSIEGFYNPLRRHAPLGYWSPVVYEQETASELPTDTLISQVSWPSQQTGQSQSELGSDPAQDGAQDVAQTTGAAGRASVSDFADLLKSEADAG